MLGEDNLENTKNNHKEISQFSDNPIGVQHCWLRHCESFLLSLLSGSQCFCLQAHLSLPFFFF